MEYRNSWADLSPATKVGVLLVVVVLVIVPAMMVYLLHDKEYSALYTGLTQEEAAQAVEGLKKLKVDYQLSEAGDTIYVESNQIATIKLDLINDGFTNGSGVGFEVFDDAAYTMSDFAKKVNYQRALQGELSRSISQLIEVKSARVHIVLPEKRFFEAQQNEPKASVILKLNQGTKLSGSQIEGIQSLVASSAEAMKPDNVIVSDEHGIILSRQTGDDRTLSNVSVRKQDLESHLEAKSLKILEHVFGKGHAVVNVNVALATSEVQAKKEMVLADANGKGVLVKSKQSVTTRADTKSKKGQSGNVMQESMETQYETGRLVETRVTKPGDVERVSLSVLVPHSVSNSQLESLRELLSATVGIDSKRGDTLAIERLPKLLPPPKDIPKNSVELVTHQGFESAEVKPTAHEWGLSINPLYVGLVGVAVAIVLSVLMFRRRQEYQLDDVERQQLLIEIKDWLNDEPVVVRD